MEQRSTLSTLMTLDGLVITRTSLDSNDAQALIASLNAELSAIYPVQGANHFRLDAQLIFRSMIALAGVEGQLQAEELSLIQRCCQKLFKRDINEIEIRKAFDHHARANQAGFAFEGAEASASPGARVFAFAAALAIAKAKGALDGAAQAKLEALAALLHLDRAEQTRAEDEAIRLEAELKTANPQ